MGKQQSVTVLVVDDEPEVRRGLARTLQRLFRVVEAASFEAFVTMLEAESPDVVLTDHDLGGPADVTGLDVLRYTAWVSPRVLRVLVSGSPPAEMGELAHLVIKKPWTDELADVVAGLLERDSSR